MVIAFSSHALMHWLHRLGGPGLVLLAQVDNSPVPVPGSMDVLLIILASSRKELWWYYGLMAFVGTMIASYFTYRLSKKGGKETLEKRIGEDRAKKVYSVFERYGFLSLMGGALAPPPIPMSAFLMAGGALQYPLRKFLAAVGLGRAIRYFLIAYLASLYGNVLIHGLYRYYKPLLIFAIVVGVGGGLVALYYFRKAKRKKKNENSHKETSIAA
jgi:membrane protein YqaA with SNARE-associated domain